jgi:hypothetical protein
MAGKKGMRSSLSRVMPVKFSADLVQQVDGRSMLGRAVRDRLERLYRDLGGSDDGGGLSFQQQSLATHAVWLDLVLSAEECKISQGQGIDTHAHVALVTSLLALYRTLGLQRRAKQVGLADYIQRRGTPRKAMGSLASRSTFRSSGSAGGSW